MYNPCAFVRGCHLFCTTVANSALDKLAKDDRVLKCNQVLRVFFSIRYVRFRSSHACLLGVSRSRKSGPVKPTSFFSLVKESDLRWRYAWNAHRVAQFVACAAACPKAPARSELAMLGPFLEDRTERVFRSHGYKSSSEVTPSLPGSVCGRESPLFGLFFSGKRWPYF